MNRTEYRRSSQNHHIHTRINYVLVSIETNKTVFCRYFLIIIFFQVITDTFQSIGKDITQCMHLDTIGCFQQVGNRTITASTTTNQANLKFLAINSLIRQFRNIVFTRLLQRSHLIAIATCRDKCRSSYQSTYTDYRRSLQKTSSIHFVLTHSIYFYGYYLISSGTSQTTRKPMLLISEYHQILFGF